MTKLSYLTLSVLALFFAACGSGDGAEKNKKADSTAKTAGSPAAGTNAGETNKAETEGDKKMETNSDGAAWEDVGGVKVRKNTTVRAQLEGYTYASFQSYNSGGGAGGYSSEKRMNFCPGGKFSMYSQSSVSVNVGGGGNSSSEESDDGSWEIYEDQQGNLFIKLSLKKSGEGFIHIVLSGGKLKLENGETLSRMQGNC